jgi:transcriptional regulator GlxA family with amidase domain
MTTPYSSASSLFGLFDTLMAAGRDWEMFVTGESEAPIFDVKLVGQNHGPATCASGFSISPDFTFDNAPQSDLLIVPGMTVSAKERLNKSESRAVEWLADRASSGTRIVSACTGALYLAEAGLLDGIEATTHWAYGDLFRRHYPLVRLRLDRNICYQDAAQGVVTSAGTTGWQELALFLIAHYGGLTRAAKAAKFWLIADRGALQAPYASMVRTLPHADAAIESAQAWVAENYSAENPVAEMIERAGLPATTFARRFRNATGQTPLDYVQTMRIEEAKQMLETTDAPVAEIGLEVGYSDAASFRRLFKRRAGITAADYRQMFGNKRFARYT